MEEHAGDEEEIGQPASTDGSDNEAGDDECRAQYRDATVERFAIVRENGFWPFSLAFR